MDTLAEEPKKPDGGPSEQTTLVPSIALELMREIESREQRVRVLSKEVATIEREVGHLRKALDAISVPGRTTAAAVSMQTGNAGRQTTSLGQSGAAKLGNSDATIVRSFARKFLASSDTPRTRREILEAMTESGIALSARDPARRIMRVLWQDEAFVHTDRGYWLADRAIPAE